MKTIETDFVSGVGGFAGPDVLTYKQLARSASYAVYERSRDGVVKDWETIVLNIKPKGFSCFNGIPLEDDTETYPSTGQWGKKGWSFKNKTAALNKFQELNAVAIPDVEGIDEDEDTTDDESSPTVSTGRRGRAPKARVALTLPAGEFTVGEVSDLNKVVYGDAIFFIKEQIEAGAVKFVREERRNAKGKPSKVYSPV